MCAALCSHKSTRPVRVRESCCSSRHNTRSAGCLARWLLSHGMWGVVLLWTLRGRDATAPPSPAREHWVRPQLRVSPEPRARRHGLCPSGQTGVHERDFQGASDERGQHDRPQWGRLTGAPAASLGCPRALGKQEASTRFLRETHTGPRRAPAEPVASCLLAPAGCSPPKVPPGRVPCTLGGPHGFCPVSECGRFHGRPLRPRCPCLPSLLGPADSQLPSKTQRVSHQGFPPGKCRGG